MILLPRYVNWSHNFRGLSLNLEMDPLCLKWMNCLIYIHVEASASLCLLQDMQWGFSLGWCISEMCCVIVSVGYHFFFFFFFLWGIKVWQHFWSLYWFYLASYYCRYTLLKVVWSWTCYLKKLAKNSFMQWL